MTREEQKHPKEQIYKQVVGSGRRSMTPRQRRRYKKQFHRFSKQRGSQAAWGGHDSEPW